MDPPFHHLADGEDVDDLDNGTGRVAQIRTVGIFMIPGKVLHDCFTIDQEFECLPIDGKMFILGHKSSLAKVRIRNFCSEQGAALYPIKENKTGKGWVTLAGQTKRG